MQTAEQIRDKVEAQAGGKVADIRYFAGGNQAALYLIDLTSGARLVAKIATQGNAPLEVEGWMLEYLAGHSDLPVPKVIYRTPGMIIMTFVPSAAGRPDAGAQHHAAELLAGLHSVRGAAYGLERDTVIGPLRQPNTPSDSWLSFFREERLLYMAKAAFEEARIDDTLLNQIEKLAAKLEDYIDCPVPPSLLHGDLWTGNVMASPGKINGFIDPAIYYGDPEMDLAFSTLFGTFGDAFFARYNEIIPPRPGFFEVRRDVYNLYPLLVHVRLFGGGYTQSVRQIVNRLVA
ncbi:MAG: fructosamine kinase family protein [Rhodospirillales bacterium]|nr:fructosamine kinase family protein [Rhodospirillales bacterium]